MKKLCKIIPVIAMAITLVACASEPPSISEPPTLSNSNGTSGSSSHVETESTTNSTSESPSEITSTSSVDNPSTTEKLPENDPETKENPGMFDFSSKTVTLNLSLIHI